MENAIIEKVVEIKASLEKVWSVFTNPDVTKKMGGYYDTNWEVGGSFGFKKVDGNTQTKGILLELQPKHLIKHSLFVSDSEVVMAIITYEFKKKNGHTLLSCKEELARPLDKETFDDASVGWEAALNAVKELAESL